MAAPERVVRALEALLAEEEAKAATALDALPRDPGAPWQGPWRQYLLAAGRRDGVRAALLALIDI